ncbi:MAG: urea amidolyase associated protein UAAP2 [Endomicrobiaceae bacterium]
MNSFIKRESFLSEKDAVYNKTIGAGDGWFGYIKEGQVLRITDIKGNQAADSLFYDADAPQDHYSAVRTITKQKNIYLTTDTVLYAESGKELMKITADTCGRHDTLGGACSSQSNTVRYAHSKEYMHNCRDTFMKKISSDKKYLKRDLAPNINFFMNVPVTNDGHLCFADGLSSKGAYIEMTALCDVMFLLSNCPQMNNPCNAYNPTPVKVTVWDKK